MAYPSVIKYLNSFPDYELNIKYSYKKDLNLTRVQGFLALLGNPQDGLRVIHIAGTKGKGSTCAFVAYILRESGFSVGLYTSPHLKDFRERIRILTPSLRGAQATKQSRKRDCFAPAGLAMTRRLVCDFEGMISKEALTGLVEELKPAINQYNRCSKYGQLSFFEIYTALAFLYFKRQKVDFAVLETGLGGRLDATNVVDPLVCGITPISLEHVQKLGNTLSKIAVEKAGIIKSSAIIISASQAKEAKAVIHQQCKKLHSEFYEVGREIKYSNSKNGLVIKGLKNNYKNLRLNLLGAHQQANAALAVGLVEGLSFYGYDFKVSDICQGLSKAVWPGRCEIIQKNPLIILDGAQNLASAQVLRQAIENNFKYQKLILVLGISADKDIAGICKELDSLADEIILTRATTQRAAEPTKLAGYFKRKLHLTPSVKEAKLLAGRLAGKQDLILVTGSLFVVGEFRNVGR
ncbi:MAG: bifunctional folylpolyglutamate synthase/dihydrofolate synthase [Candidatus Omnitrophica bacterium]|nr:bifunctional folylpolyglutamate synthase/dihydrofolate synthase [Candidatus Omnitrophota bacterium]